MRGYLIDTNVISEYNREQLPHAGVVKWLDTTPEASQYVSARVRAMVFIDYATSDKGNALSDTPGGFLREFKSALRIGLPKIDPGPSQS